MLLQTAANGGDSLSIEPEPMHTPGVAGMLDLQTTIHHHGQATFLRDAGAFLVDDRELTPQALGANRHRVPGDTG